VFPDVLKMHGGQSEEMRSELNRVGVRLLDWQEFRELNQAR
jgi:hypothetical protein